MKIFIKDLFSKCDQILVTADLVTFTEEILNGKIRFLCGALIKWRLINWKKCYKKQHLKGKCKAKDLIIFFI